MSALAVLRALRSEGGTVSLDGGNLRLRAPAPLPPALVSAVRAEKPGLIRLLSGHADALDRLDDFEERAAILEFGGHLSRSEAERKAWDDIFGNSHDVFP
ncbi:hypothetical protein [Azospirillum picis]|uniref:TubC N-terminal docking domain-containing protein n=1 Tax=Azospirillum picis TaxID=488438 RepID=A0ABU0MSH4_9PROT|nr:hypothetical protein [Azospirillum picis]MBP2301953.1 hypothetical protein [Azospirillum picis]MDQ0536402.1 hypothetical protein [Azospirillum picis]